MLNQIHPLSIPLNGIGKLHFFSLFCLPYILGCFICSVSAGNISGKVYYNGSQEGQITVVATNPSPKMQSLNSMARKILLLFQPLKIYRVLK